MSLIHVKNLTKHIKVLNCRSRPTRYIIVDDAFRFTFTYILPIGFIAFYPSQIFLCPQEVSPITLSLPANRHHHVRIRLLVLANATFKALFEEKLQEVYEKAFTSDAMTNAIDQYSTLIH